MFTNNTAIVFEVFSANRNCAPTSCVLRIFFLSSVFSKSTGFSSVDSYSAFIFLVLSRDSDCSTRFHLGNVKVPVDRGRIRKKVKIVVPSQSHKCYAGQECSVSVAAVI